MGRHVATRGAQRGWAGLVALLLALVIVGLLARTALTRYGLLGASTPDAATGRAPTSRETSAMPGPTTAVAAPQAPIERARALESMLQQKADGRAREVDSAAR